MNTGTQAGSGRPEHGGVGYCMGWASGVARICRPSWYSVPVAKGAEPAENSCLGQRLSAHGLSRACQFSASSRPDPVLYLSNPRRAWNKELEARFTRFHTAGLNQMRLGVTGDPPEIATRISSFEMAFSDAIRGAPELMDDLLRANRKKLLEN